MQKRITALFIFIIALFVQNARSQTVTFSYTGTTQTWTVPPCITSVSVDAIGATGGAGWGNLMSTTYYSVGGNGGRVQCVLAVTPGQVLQINVGGKGDSAVLGAPYSAGGYNGGGAAHVATGLGYGGGGGGASDVRVSPYNLVNRLVVAAGGGGGAGSACAGTGNPDRGGYGGGTTGGTGYSCNSNTGSDMAFGGFSSMGGSGGRCTGTTLAGGGNGQLGRGGDGNINGDGGGGGGGYYGGGGGCMAGGAGGSSYADASLASSVTHTQDYNSSGHGRVTITVIPCTAVKPVTEEHLVTILPNPAHNLLTIQTGNIPYRKYTITNAVGQQLVTGNINAATTEADLTALRPGIYFITVSGEYGNITRRFIKE